MNEIEQIAGVAQSMAENGVAETISAAFVIVAVGVLLGAFVWMRNTLNKMIEGQQALLQRLTAEIAALSESVKTFNRDLGEVAEALRPKSLLEIKDHAAVCFELAEEKVCRIIKKVRDENNIADHEATRRKIRTLLHNLHDERNTRFENTNFKGRPLSEYTSEEWVDWVTEIVWSEVYAPVVNNKRAYTNVCAVYDRIENDFNKKLTQ